jgi:phosphoribosylamine--glycine ligase
MIQSRAFGDAGTQIVIEERLIGPEVSLLAFSDGKEAVLMPPTRDYKRAYDGGEGPNTGGMGAFGPVPGIDLDRFKREFIQPVIDGMAAQGTPYTGVLYAGIMLTPDGPRVLEYNCRFGDPETQVLLPLIESDLFEIMMACVNGGLDETSVRWQDAACVTVVASSPGYPGSYPKGLPITGLTDVQDAIVFHAGTALDPSGGVVTAGGRVLAVSAVGPHLNAARDTAYAGLDVIAFDDMHFRTDIGQ